MKIIIASAQRQKIETGSRMQVRDLFKGECSVRRIGIGEFVKETGI
jgi:hypothetical protein